MLTRRQISLRSAFFGVRFVAIFLGCLSSNYRHYSRLRKLTSQLDPLEGVSVSWMRELQVGYWPYESDLAPLLLDGTEEMNARSFFSNLFAITFADRRKVFLRLDDRASMRVFDYLQMNDDVLVVSAEDWEPHGRVFPSSVKFAQLTLNDSQPNADSFLEAFGNSKLRFLSIRVPYISEKTMALLNSMDRLEVLELRLWDHFDSRLLCDLSVHRELRELYVGGFELEFAELQRLATKLPSLELIVVGSNCITQSQQQELITRHGKVKWKFTGDKLSLRSDICPLNKNGQPSREGPK